MNHELHALLGEPTIATQAKIGDSGGLVTLRECTKTVPSGCFLTASTRTAALADEQEHSTQDGGIKSGRTQGKSAT